MENIAEKAAPALDSASRLASIKKPLEPEFKAIDALITKQLENQLELTQEVCEYIINSGGKRLRPLMLVLTAKVLGYQGEQHIKLAAILEFLHTATLLHDDVIDHSELRRNRETANSVWDNETSILMGDFLHALSFDMIVSTEDINVMKVFARATNTVINGEIIQLIWRKNPLIQESSYKEIIQFKTARLFSAATEIGALISNCSEQDVRAMETYGNEFGIAYQLIDDMLDYTGSTEKIGKNIGDDLAEGKLTLPLIYALQNGSPAQTKIIRQAITREGTDQLGSVLEVMTKTGALKYTHQQAKAHGQRALTVLKQLPPNLPLNPLRELIHFVLEDQIGSF